jgi:hypothetical protein
VGARSAGATAGPGGGVTVIRITVVTAKMRMKIAPKATPR